ncbi:hypothetical protein [Streptomyces sp. BPTC-684]|uniref:hypothetical protein n=1 Tax=Streptomyces sp. BPTC-684 TaxID=3043734 RepID=UPI0024B08A78|nr:hypothetical protein [Streptomyces sp. BPTC-684]WHM40662.1 hypothetical protein QIY60_29840 [Streptomyces sp. BPTC-684]
MTAWPGRERQQRHPGAGEAPMEGMRLRRLSRWQAEDLREDLADLYVESYLYMVDPGCPFAAEHTSRQGFLRRLAANVRQPGFAMLIAETTAPAGCAFGYPVRPDGTWWLGFEGALPQRVDRLTASGRVLAVTEIVAHPREQDHGLAQQLQEQLLAARHASLGVALVNPADRTTHAAFRSWGWEDLGEIRRPSSQTVRRVLVLPCDGSPAAPRAPRRGSATAHL